MLCLLSCVSSLHVRAWSQAHAIRLGAWTAYERMSIFTGEGVQNHIPCRRLSSRLFLREVRCFECLRGGCSFSGVVRKKLLGKVESSGGEPSANRISISLSERDTRELTFGTTP